MVKNSNNFWPGEGILEEHIGEKRYFCLRQADYGTVDVVFLLGLLFIFESIRDTEIFQNKVVDPKKLIPWVEFEFEFCYQ